MIHHVTYHVPMGTLDSADLSAFFWLLDMEELVPNDEFEHGWKVRWFRDNNNSRAVPVHLVESGPNEWDALMLGHFCVEHPEVEAIRAIADKNNWLERASGSGRIWLKLANLRVEVRPA